MRLFRSLLFAPGNHARRSEKALGLDADAVILDLEDACPIDEKVATRDIVVETLRRPRRALGYVRINSMTSDFGYGDLCAVVAPGVDGVMLTKVDDADMVKVADWLIGQIERERGLPPRSIDLIPLIETGAGLANAHSIGAAAARVRRLALGAGDLTLDLGLHWSREESELTPFRAALVLASRTAGLEPPIDLAWIDTKDAQGFANSVRWGRSLGFQGKLCIHPDQVAPINEAFSPTDDEIAKARRIVDAFDAHEAAGSVAFAVDGELVDYAIAERARRTLAAAERVAGGSTE